MLELCDLSAVELRRLIGAKSVSPREVLESCIRRIERVNPTLNAIVATDFERAEHAAREAEQAVLAGEALGPLHGLPIGIKDLNETKGLRTTHGSVLFADHVPTEDDYVTASIRAAGGIIAAKTNTPEFGAGANTVNAVYGATANPFDPAKTCAGSSGGSAVALATSMLPLCNGSDLGGSLRTPAAFCGVTGLRPSPGVVPRPAALAAFSPLSVEGPMARSVADLCLLLSAMAGSDRRDPFSRPGDPRDFASPQAADLSSLKVAISEDLGFAPVDEAVRRCFRDRTARFAGIFAAVETCDPDLDGADQAFAVLRATGFLAAYKDLYERARDRLGPNVRANIELGLGFSAAEVAAAQTAHSNLFRRFVALMDRCDALICPAAAVQPFSKEQLFPTTINGEPLGSYYHWLAITYAITLTAHPAVVLPCGVDEAGLPFGIQVVGRLWGDRELLAVASALEAHLQAISGCGRPLPDLNSLSS